MRNKRLAFASFVAATVAIGGALALQAEPAASAAPSDGTSTCATIALNNGGTSGTDRVSLARDLPAGALLDALTDGTSGEIAAACADLGVAVGGE